MKRQIKSLEEERSKLQEENSRLQEQLQTAQACEYSVCCLDICFVNNNYKNILPPSSPNDHARLLAVAQVLVETIDSEEGSSNSKSLVERLEEAPKKIFDVMMATSKN